MPPAGFGCLAHVFHPPGERKTLTGFSVGGKKLVTRASSGVYLGPSMRSPGSMVYVKNSPHKSGGPTMMVSAHVQFCEDEFSGDNDIDMTKSPSEANTADLNKRRFSRCHT